MLWLISILLQVTLVCLIAWPLAGLLQRRAAARYWVLFGLLVVILLSPALSAVTQHWGWGLLAVQITDESQSRELSPERSALERQPRPKPRRFAEWDAPPAGEEFSKLPPSTTRDVSPSLTRPANFPANAAPTPASQLQSESPSLAMSALPEPQKEAGDNAQPAGILATVFRSSSVFLTLLCVWGAGALVVCVRFGRSLRRLAIIKREAQEIDGAKVGGVPLTQLVADVSTNLRFRRPAGVQLSRQLSTPIVVGLFRPRVLLPVTLLKDVDAAQLREILIHECAHVMRRDPIAVVMQNLATVLFWFHPLVRKVNRWISLAREEVCDNYVLNLTDGKSYSRTLLRTAQLMSHELFPAAVGIMGGNWKLEARVAGILDKRRSLMTRTSLRSRICLAGVVAIAAVAIGLGNVTSAKPKGNSANIATGHAEYTNATVRGNSNVLDSSAQGNAVETQTITGVVVNQLGEVAADVEVRCLIYDDSLTTRSNAQGEFQFEIPSSRFLSSALIAQDQDGLMAGHHFDRRAKPEDAQGITLQLKPAREVNFAVQDEDGSPVAGAMAAAMHVDLPVARGSTDERGLATLRLPSDLPISHVFAFKDEVGLDYFHVENTEWRNSPFAVSLSDTGEAIKFVLNGMKSIPVKVELAGGSGIEGVKVYSFGYSKPDKGGSVNLTGVGPPFAAITNEAGMAEFIFPADQTDFLALFTHKDRLHMPRRLQYDPKSSVSQLSSRMVMLVPISGTVTYPDGSPAANREVMVVADGHGSDNYLRRTVRTNDQGVFQLESLPNAYCQAVPLGTDDWAAESQLFVTLEAPVSAIDFTLCPATVISGQVNDDQGNPLAGENVSAMLDKDVLRAIPKDKRPPNPTNDRGSTEPTIPYWTVTDEEGRFSFVVGPGEYRVNTRTGTEYQEVNVTNQPRVEVNFETKPRPTYQITGRITNKATGEPLESASIGGFAADISQNSGMRTVDSNADGVFSGTRGPGEIVAIARSADESLATVIAIPQGQAVANVALEPTVSIKGRLVDQTTGEPLPNAVIQYGMRQGRATFIDTFGGQLSTDDSGSFIIPGLVAGQTYELSLRRTIDEHQVLRRLRTLAEDMELGDIQVDLPQPPAAKRATGGIAAANQDSDSTETQASAQQVDPIVATITGTVNSAEGQPVPGADVECHLIYQTLHGKTNAAGQFEFPVPNTYKTLWAIVAANEDRSLMGMHAQGGPAAETEIHDVEVALAPSRKLQAHVVNEHDQPVAGAEVALHNSWLKIGKTTSDASGQATVIFPADAPLIWIYAIEENTGLDYFCFAGSILTENASDTDNLLPQDQSAPISFVLNGLKSVTVRAEFGHGAPVHGVRIAPSSIEKPGKRGEFFLANSAEPFVKYTDDAGLATIPVPADNIGFVSLSARKSGMSSPSRLAYDPASNVDYMTVKLNLLVRVSGQVTRPDGSPAADVEIIADGNGYERHERPVPRRIQKTDAEGRYEFDASPNIYIHILADDQPNRLSKSQALVIREQPVSVNLKLEQATTRIFGRLTNGDGQPLANERVGLTTPDRGYRELPEEEKLPNPTNSGHSPHALIRRNTNTDANGRYEFFVSPGEYWLYGSGRLATELEVTDETEIEHDITQEAPPEFFPITGRVINKADGTAVAGAMVGGDLLEDRGSRSGFADTVADDDANFQSQRLPGEALLRAMSPDRKLAALVKLDPNQTEVEIALEPTVSVTGRLIDRATGAPLRNEQFQYSFWTGKISIVGDAWSGRMTTDADGKFRITGLSPGQEYHVSFISRGGGFVPTFTTGNAEEDEKNVGDIPYINPFRPGK